MRHRGPGPFLLLATCSNCNQHFRDGAARHMLGNYPMEQFCRYKCAEEYLESDHGLERALPVPPRGYGKATNRHLD